MTAKQLAKKLLELSEEDQEKEVFYFYDDDELEIEEIYDYANKICVSY